MHTCTNVQKTNRKICNFNLWIRPGNAYGHCSFLHAQQATLLNHLCLCAYYWTMDVQMDRCKHSSTLQFWKLKFMLKISTDQPTLKEEGQIFLAKAMCLIFFGSPVIGCLGAVAICTVCAPSSVGSCQVEPLSLSLAHYTPLKLRQRSHLRIFHRPPGVTQRQLCILFKNAYTLQ